SVPSRPKRTVPSAALPSRSSMNRVCTLCATAAPFLGLIGHYYRQLGRQERAGVLTRPSAVGFYARPRVISVLGSGRRGALSSRSALSRPGCTGPLLFS